MKINLNLKLEIREPKPNSMATVYYPNEGSRIEFNKGLSVLDFSDALFHEIGHIIDWYLSNGSENQGDHPEREYNADLIASKLVKRYKKELKHHEQTKSSLPMWINKILRCFSKSKL